MKNKLSIIIILFCITLLYSEINYNSDQSNFLGISISENDLNAFVTELGNAGIYNYTSGYTYLSQPMGTDFNWIWWYNVKFPGLTNLRLIPVGNSGLRIGFRTDMVSIRAIRSLCTGDPSCFKWTWGVDLPICSHSDDYFEIEVKTTKDETTGSYNISLKPCLTLTNLGLSEDYQCFLNKWLNNNIFVYAIGEVFNGLPDQIMETATPTTTVSDRKLMIGWNVKKQKKNDLTPILNLLLDD